VVYFSKALQTGACIAPESIKVTHDFTYDHTQGLLSDRTTTVGYGGDGSDGSVSFDLAYDYDRWGNVSTIAYPEQTLGQCTEAPAVTYTWDAVGLNGVSYAYSGHTQRILRDPLYDDNTGMMTSWWTPAGIGSIGEAPAEVKHQVFPEGTKSRVKQIKATDGDLLTFFDTGTYSYDAAGNITAIAGSAGVTAEWTYTYDLLQRLTSSSTSTGSRSYTYDDFGSLNSIGGTSIPVDIASNRLKNGTA
jgi:YD repeat-containing protein